MKKAERIHVIEEHQCKLPCDCGWNITVGGTEKKDYQKLKKFIKSMKGEHDD